MPSVNAIKAGLKPAPTIINLFFSFLKLGTVSFGGPPMVVYIRTMTVEQKKWLDDKSFQDGVALSQTIPGIITMHTAAYVGLRLRGIAGAAVCFLGFGFPAFLFMMLLSALYVRTHSLPPVVSALHGLQAIIVALVAHATYSFGRTSLKNSRDIIIAGASSVLFLTGVHPILVILLSAILGIMLYYRHILNTGEGDYLGISDSGKTFFPFFFIAVAGLAFLFFTQRNLFSLTLLMAKITVFAFGGGFTALPLMFHEVVTVRSWMDAQTLMNGIALGQITPGPIMLTATFIGYYLYGFPGGLAATLGIFLPSFLILIATVPHYDRLRASRRFTNMMQGILCSFTGLLLSVTIYFAQNIPWDISRGILACSALLVLFLKVEIIWVVLAGMAISVLML